MKKNIFDTLNNNSAATLCRVTLGAVLFPHGAQKLLGWFGGFGFEGSMSYFTGTIGLPWIVGFLVILIEFFGAISLILGFATRLWSFAIIVLTVGIVHTSHSQFGFFMNWLGNQKGEGFEYFILMLGLAISLIISGAGRYSIDSWIASKKDSHSNKKFPRRQSAIVN